jgi:hypothetical protein
VRSGVVLGFSVARGFVTHHWCFRMVGPENFFASSGNFNFRFAQNKNHVDCLFARPLISFVYNSKQTKQRKRRMQQHKHPSNDNKPLIHAHC